ncbi:MAG: allophanate hydrolase [Granulosicoccus sp.]
MSLINDLTLDGVRALYAAGTTPAELMNHLRERALQFSDHNVFIHLLSEEELAPLIESLMTMNPQGKALWGVPFVIKDNIDLANVVTTAACEAFAYTPVSSATVVKRLIDQGALPLGKANLDQFATGLNGTRSPYGACHNSFDPSLISGGSSAGSAVAVALGLATFSLGTDTAGSGRVPACFNNLVGVKPSRGLLSAHGVVPACRSLDCVSLFTLHCDDANTVLSVAEGFDESDSYSRSNPYDNKAHAYGRFDSSLTLGVIPPSQLRFFGDDEYQLQYHHTLAELEKDGIQLLELDYAPFDEAARLLYEGPWVAERYLATMPLIEERPEAIFPVVRDIVAQGAIPTAADLFRAQYRLSELAGRCRQQLARVDALLTPTAGRLFSIDEMLAEPARHNSELGYYMNFVNLLDMAALAVPTGFTTKGLPFGVTLSAAAFSDRRLLSIGNRIQATFSLPLGAQRFPAATLSETSVGRTDWMELVVCGAHLQGMPLNFQLTERGAVYQETTETSAQYRFYALEEGAVKRPALIRTDAGGAAVEVEVWRIPSVELGSFLKGIAPPLGLGKVTLADGRVVCGFIAEASAVSAGTDITPLGSWRRYCQSLGH